MIRGGRLGLRSKPSDSRRAAGRGVGPLVGRIEGQIASRHAVTSRQSSSVPDPIYTVRHRVGRASCRSGKVGRSPCPPGVVGQAVRQPVHRVSDGRLVGRASARAGVRALPVGLAVNGVSVGVAVECGLARLCRFDCLLGALPVRLRGDARLVRQSPRWALASFVGQSLTRALTLPDWPGVVLLVSRAVPRGHCVGHGLGVRSVRLCPTTPAFAIKKLSPGSEPATFGFSALHLNR